MVLIQLDSETL
jgi:hypothetical protein